MLTGTPADWAAVTCSMHYEHCIPLLMLAAYIMTCLCANAGQLTCWHQRVRFGRLHAQQPTTYSGEPTRHSARQRSTSKETSLAHLLHGKETQSLVPCLRTLMSTKNQSG